MAPKVPPVNAIVTMIRGAGFTDDYDGTATPGTVKWSGSAPAYVTEKVLVETGRGTVDQLVVTRAVIPDNLGATIATGDQITLVKAGETFTRTVQNIEERSDYGFLRCHFEDA